MAPKDTMKGTKVFVVQSHTGEGTYEVEGVFLELEDARSEIRETLVQIHEMAELEDCEIAETPYHGFEGQLEVWALVHEGDDEPWSDVYAIFERKIG